ncbi:putative isopropanol dehydrogenase [Cadophora sp. DSE1049]|nr:putative isopropanol dehydrogenase [Cadophora sp. DSE1049]
MAVPQTHRALVLSSLSEPLKLTTLPIPTVVPGAVVVRILGTYVLPYLSSVLDGTLPYTLSLPMIPGANSIARIHAVGPDAVSLKPGKLVLCDQTVRARDAPEMSILMGLHGGAAKGLMDGEWRDGSFAEYARFPLENVFALDEERLFGELKYTVEDLVGLPANLVPYGGLSEIGIKPGDTVIVVPATGRFGGGAVTTALALGATVVACGRNKATLKKMKAVFASTGRIETVILTGDAEEDTQLMVAASGNGGKGADAYIDFSPAEAVASTHITAALTALRPFGKAAFMGGIWGKVMLEYNAIMMKSLRIQGRFMYDRHMVVQMVKMIEKGNLKLGEEGTGIKTVGKFGLDAIEEALELAKKESGWGKQVVLMP